MLRLDLAGGNESLPSAHAQAGGRWHGQDELVVGRMTERQLDIRVEEAEIGQVSAAVGYLLVHALTQKSGLLIHAGGLVQAGRAHVFVGPSGAGKSTLVHNASGASCLHEDKVAIRRAGGSWRAWGVPMLDNSGTTGRNLSAPLAGLYLIQKGGSLCKTPMGGRELLGELTPQVIVPFQAPQVRKKIFHSMLALVAEVGAYRLHFRRDSDVGDVIGPERK